jgi:hypothetical protein
MRRILLSLSTLLLSLSACAPAVKVQTESLMETHIKTITRERRAAMVARIEKAAKGISIGTGAPNKAFVFFDPACSYCADLWRATQPLKGQVDVVWIPVSVFGEDSTVLSAAILQSKNPASLMSANEEAMRKTGNPITVKTVPSDAARARVASNTDLMTTLDPTAPIQAVPLMYYKSADGRVEVISGSMDAEALKSALKLE